jgi:structure-specific recognition protein 1
MKDYTHEIVSRVFKALCGKKVIKPGNYKSQGGSASLKCSCKANDGSLWVLEKSFFFIKKPALYIRMYRITLNPSINDSSCAACYLSSLWYLIL